MVYKTDNIPKPFDAYKGTKPYIFVSYSHKDSQTVYPILEWLNNQGYRIWYDEGSDPGNDWPEAIANALAKAACFVVFLSPAAVKSKNVKNEINFAITKNRPFLPVYLSGDTVLPLGLELSIGHIQAIMKYEITESRFREKIGKVVAKFKAKEPETVTKEPRKKETSPPVKQQSVPPSNSESDNNLIRKFNLVLVKGGTFQMGSTKGRSNEKPVHSVTLSDFYIGKYEVTQAQWQAVIGTNPSSNKKGGNYPVERVSWNDCQEFIRKINNATGEQFRLPTEAEWEYAARGGNVWEWCGDWYGSDYYENSPGDNPVGPESAQYRVLRGGSFVSTYSEVLRCSVRFSGWPVYRSSDIGFRLVRAL